MTQYLLAVHPTRSAEEVAPEVLEKAYRDVDAFNEELQAAGAWVFAGGLEPPGTAKVVSVQDGSVLTTDGPFAETKEQLGGFWVIEVGSEEEALRWASKATAACMDAVEVRAFQSE